MKKNFPFSTDKKFSNEEYFSSKTVCNVIGAVLGATIAKFIKGFVYASGAILAIKVFM